MSPHETLFLESTHNVDIHYIENNQLIRFQTWDFGGDLNINGEGIVYDDQLISTETIFKNASSLIYVIDAQEEDYEVTYLFTKPLAHSFIHSLISH